MNRPTITLTFIVAHPDQEVRRLAVPQGEAAYWAQVARRRADASTPSGAPKGVAVVPDESPRLPYLGQIACPNDELAKAWLADQHGGRQ